MKKIIIGTSCVLLVVAVIVGVVFVLHGKNESSTIPESSATISTTVVSEELESLVESVATEEYVPEVSDYSMEAAVSSVVSYILNNEVLSKYFTKEDIGVKVRDGDTVIFLGNCDKVGYPEKELDAYVIPVTGEPYDCDGPIELYHWLVNKEVPADVVEEDPSKADLFNEGSATPAAGWKPIDLSIFSNVEEWGTFSDTDIETWYNADFLSAIKSKTGGYEVLSQLTNFLNMDAPYIGDTWQVSLDDPTADDMWGTIHVNRGGVPHTYRMRMNLVTQEFNIFEEE